MHDETLAAGLEPPVPSAHVLPTTYPDQPFEFRGTAREYFCIWIVNFALSIVTLGIYSAWASVRTRRYFYANTRLAGSPFEYSAQPLPILRGRLLAVLMFSLYVLASRTSWQLQLITAGLIGLIMPWLIVRGLAFRARYSSWRGLPFRFEPDFAGAYKWYFAVYPLLLLSFGLAYPWMKARQQQWTLQNHRYGNAAFDFNADVTDYYLVFFASIGIAFAYMMFVGIGATSVIAYFTSHYGKTGMRDHVFVFMAVFYAMYLPAYLGIYAYNRSRMLNLLYNNATLAGGHKLRSTLGYWALFWIYSSNLIAIVCTLGLAVPWAKVRMARYRTSHLVLQPAGDLDAFVAETSAQTDVGALGAEMDNLFSIDIGL